MREDNLTQQAIAAARAGRELTARDMFLRIVESDPRNELAWMWLTGLLDDLDDKVYACEKILGINPANINARRYLDQLLAEKQKFVDAENIRIAEELRRIREEIKLGRRNSALAAIRALVLNPLMRDPDGWRLLANLSPELDERVHALENLSDLIPNDPRLLEELRQARHYKEHPIHQAELYEEHGDIDKALAMYRMIALKPESKGQWNKIYWKVTQLENQKHEHIAHISPALNIARLTAGPPIVYFLFAMIHVGVNPFDKPDPLIWLGLLWVALGGFMIALASVRSHHRLWMLVFKDVSANGSPVARRVTAASGWVLVLLPYVMMFVVAWHRLWDYFSNLKNLLSFP